MKYRKLFETTSMALTLITAAGVSSAARAQSAAPAQTAAPAEDAGDIIVTARNRREKLQDVPLAITALTGEQLERTGTRELQDVANQTPGLSMNVGSGGGEVNSRPSIRGITPGNADPSVAIFYDGAFLYNNSAQNIALIDMERVEVVKGPVNSLYGRPAYAGAINYVSRVPDYEFGGSANALVGNDGQRKLVGVLDIPIVKDVFAIRVGGYYEHYSGGYKDQVNGLRDGGYVKRDAQISYLLDASSNLKINGRVYYGNDSFGQSPLVFNNPNCGPFDAQTPFFTTPRQLTTCGKFNENERPLEVSPESRSSNLPANDRRIWNMFNRITLQTAIGTFSSLTTYTDVKAQKNSDFNGLRDGIPFVLIKQSDAALGNAAPSQGIINLVATFGVPENTKDVAQELRYQSPLDKPIRITAGGYFAYFKDYNETLVTLNSDKIPAGYTIRGGATPCALFLCDRTFLSAHGEPGNAKTIAQTQSTLYSVFGGVEADPLRGLTVSAEGRYSTDTRELDAIQSNSAFTVNNVLGDVSYIYRPVRTALNPTGAPLSKKFSFFTGRGSVRYKLAADQMVYVSVANGVKVGGFNARSLHPEELTYGNEKNITYELGLKSQFLNRRVTFNAALFLIDLNNLQVSAASRFADTVGTVVQNAGAAQSKGFDADVAVKATDWLRVNAGVGYNESKFRGNTYDFSFAGTCAAVGAAFCDQSRIAVITTPQGTATVYKLDGLRPPYAPALTVSLGTDVNFQVGNGWSLFGNARYRYQSKQYVATSNINWYGPSAKIDAVIGVEKGPMRFTVFVNNLTKSTVPDLVVPSSRLDDFKSYQYGTLPNARRFGVTAGYTF